MAVELTFERKEGVPWGFRLVGGLDHGIPVTVVKVQKGSIAEKTGLQEGDLLVRIGDKPTDNLHHHHIEDLLKSAGDNFVAAVIRNKLPDELKEAAWEESLEAHGGFTQSLEVDLKATVTDETLIQYQEGLDMEVEEINQKSFTEQMLELSEMMESKMIGSSKEIHKLSEEEIKKLLKETGTIDEEIRKKMGWSAFLQKPDRPIPTPKSADFKVLSPVSEEVTIRIKQKSQSEEVTEFEIVEEKHEERSQEIRMESSEHVRQELREETPQEMREESHQEYRDKQHAEINEKYSSKEERIEENTTTETELSLDEQLAAIQRQLLALSQLPAAIQQTLDVVTQQLTKIVGPTETEEPHDDEEHADRSTSEAEHSAEEKEDVSESHKENEEESELTKEAAEEEEETKEAEETKSEEGETEEKQPDEQKPPEPELTPEEQEAARIKAEEMEKKQKEREIMEDLMQRRLKERPVHPLTPLERPILLPGGRKWGLPDEANPTIRHPDMSDEFIAETISSQSEIITGTTLGINFLKFKPPPKPLDHLKNSEVYKMIHEEEKTCRGVGYRPEKLLAAEDYYAKVQKTKTETKETIQQTKG